MFAYTNPLYVLEVISARPEELTYQQCTPTPIIRIAL